MEDAHITSNPLRDSQLERICGMQVALCLYEGVGSAEPPKEIEEMVGVTADPQFGPLIAFGLGGIYVEIMSDVKFRVMPLTNRDAAEMVREIRGYRLLQGYRGHPAADVEAIQEVLLRISRLVEEIQEISEMDLNPIFSFPPGEGCRIVDARIRIGLPVKTSADA